MSRESPTTKFLYARLTNLHESSYLTLLSIVQGVATGFLATSIPERIALNVECILFLATLAFIILMWNEYIMGVASLKWIPTLSDAIIPFTFCLNEIVLSRKLAEPRQWFFAAAVFGIISFLAFGNMYAKAAQYRDNDEMLKNLGLLKPISQYSCLLAAASFLSFALAEHLWFEEFFPALAILIVALFAFRTHLYWHRVVEYSKSS